MVAKNFSVDRYKELKDAYTSEVDMFEAGDEVSVWIKDSITESFPGQGDERKITSEQERSLYELNLLCVII